MNMLAALMAIAATYAAPEAAEVRWGGPAETAYAAGFVENLRRHPEGGVALFDMELIENDAAGAGMNEHGVVGDAVWGPYHARKNLQISDPRAHRAFLVIFTHSETPPHRLTFTVNGYEGFLTKDNRETYRWAEFPVEALKAGMNTVELSCPEAQSADEGWDIYLAQAEEFRAGGGDPGPVGSTSFRSDDGGTTWAESPFGPEGQTRAEYAIRISLDRYRPVGYLETPVIDLWRGDAADLIVPLRAVEDLTIKAAATLPEGTQVTYFVRGGTEPDPRAEAAWKPYDRLGAGAELEAVISGECFHRRYAQVRAVLTTSNPLASPILQTLEVQARCKDQVTPAENIHLIASENPPIRYPSVAWEWEKANRPEFEELRARESLDEVIASARTEFDAQVKLMDHASKRWHGGGPLPEYPGWDALSILDRIDKGGSGGMCIQANNFLGGMCMAYGWQARLVNITSHETCEVWNDDYGKWIYLDGYHVNHYAYDLKTGEPLSLLELHQRYLNVHYPDHAIDWMKDQTWGRAETADYGVGLGVPGPRHASHNGVCLAAFMRMVPRNNWYEKPFPRPLSHGCTWWPWDGYINWYDDRTPPKRQYSHHTDRPQDMWPELNRVHIHATSMEATDRLALTFETYTPNFSHYEVNPDDTGWREAPSRWLWLLQSGRNVLQVRAVTERGVKGKPSVIELNRTNVP